MSMEMMAPIDLLNWRQLVAIGDSKVVFVSASGFAGIVEANQDHFAFEQ